MKVLFLDAYNLIYRALSGFTKGDNYIIYNFFRSLRPIIETHSPDKVYFVLEGNPKFRLDLSEGDYKSNRKSRGSDFHRQKAAIINMVKQYLPFSVVRHPELECDDTIATLCIQHARQGNNCTIVSSDSDFIQLIDHNGYNIKLYHPIKKKYIQKPEYDYVTWKALRGDKTDNINGIPGIGDKTATKLVTNPDKLKTLLEDRNKRAIFEKNVNLIRLVDFSNDLSVLEHHASSGDFSNLRTVFNDLGFDSIIKQKSWEKYVKTFERL